MRVNTRKALDAFLCGKAAKPAESIWTDGSYIYSYRTIIVTRNADGSATLDTRRFSVTTTIHQNALRVGLAAAGVTLNEYVSPL